MVEDRDEIRDQIFQFFRSRWTAPLGKDTHLQGSQLMCSFFDAENVALTHPVSAKEVRGAL